MLGAQGHIVQSPGGSSSTDIVSPTLSNIQQLKFTYSRFTVCSKSAFSSKSSFNSSATVVSSSSETPSSFANRTMLRHEFAPKPLPIRHSTMDEALSRQRVANRKPSRSDMNAVAKSPRSRARSAWTCSNLCARVIVEIGGKRNPSASGMSRYFERRNA